jgi:hypothetical protein
LKSATPRRAGISHGHGDDPVQFHNDNTEQFDRWSLYLALMVGVLAGPALVLLASLRG